MTNGASYTASTTDGLSGRRMRKYWRVDASPVSGTTRTCGPRASRAAGTRRFARECPAALAIVVSIMDVRHDELSVSLNDGAIAEAGSSRNCDAVGDDAAVERGAGAHADVIPDDAVGDAARTDR